LRANGSRESAPVGSEAIQKATKKDLDCFVARVPRNDVESFSANLSPSLRAKRSNPVTRKQSWMASSQGLLAMTAEP
jgi:hypothetical protein